MVPNNHGPGALSEMLTVVSRWILNPPVPLSSWPGGTPREYWRSHLIFESTPTTDGCCNEINGRKSNAPCLVKLRRHHQIIKVHRLPIHGGPHKQYHRQHFHQAHGHRFFNDWTSQVLSEHHFNAINWAFDHTGRLVQAFIYLGVQRVHPFDCCILLRTQKSFTAAFLNVTG